MINVVHDKKTAAALCKRKQILMKEQVKMLCGQP